MTCGVEVIGDRGVGEALADLIKHVKRLEADNKRLRETLERLLSAMDAALDEVEPPA